MFLHTACVSFVSAQSDYYLIDRLSFPFSLFFSFPFRLVFFFFADLRVNCFFELGDFSLQISVVIFFSPSSAKLPSPLPSRRLRHSIIPLLVIL